MTPSEIADALDEVVATQEASRLAYKATELAAATIRELDKKCKGIQHRADLDRALNERMRRLLEEADAKLKIATEALKEVTASNANGAEGYAHGECIRLSNEALARIKEVG